MVDVLLENLTKRFHKLVAVDKLNISIKNGEFIGLLGRPRAGKTTTLRMIAGLERPTEGRIYIGGRDVTDLPPKDRKVGMAFENLVLYPHMTAYEHLAFPLKKMKLSKSEIDKKVKEVAEMLRIDHRLHNLPGMLSGGERQRLTLGRALVKDPEVLLLDEPLTNLDAKLRVYMRVELKRLQRRLGTTAIFATADDIEALSMADRIAVLHKGKLLQYDTPEVIYKKPQNILVARLVGWPRINTLVASLVEKDGMAYLEFGAFKLNIGKSTKLFKNKLTGNEVIGGFRPADVTIYKKALPNSVEAKPLFLEETGDQVILHLEVGDDFIKAVVPEGFKVEDKVWIGISADKIHVFDKKTGVSVL